MPPGLDDKHDDLGRKYQDKTGSPVHFLRKGGDEMRCELVLDPFAGTGGSRRRSKDS